MPSLKARADDSVLIVVDEQPTFMQGIDGADRVIRRSEFLLKIANLVGVPILATEQYPERMGSTDERIAQLLPQGGSAVSKMTFSCCGCNEFLQRLEGTGRTQVVLVGIETHICVSQTALDFISDGFQVIVCADAVSSRSAEQHQLGLNRMREAGALLVHSESVAYEWMESAEHQSFRDALKLVKEYA